MKKSVVLSSLMLALVLSACGKQEEMAEAPKAEGTVATEAAAPAAASATEAAAPAADAAACKVDGAR